jgi:hypothetical protein
MGLFKSVVKGARRAVRGAGTVFAATSAGITTAAVARFRPRALGIKSKSSVGLVKASQGVMMAAGAAAIGAPPTLSARTTPVRPAVADPAAAQLNQVLLMMLISLLSGRR